MRHHNFSSDNEQYQCVGSGRVQCSRLHQGPEGSHLHSLQDISREGPSINF